MKISYSPTKYTPKNLYKVSVEFMHGDADGYSNETFEFRNMTKEQFSVYLMKVLELKDIVDSDSDLRQHPEVREKIIYRWDDDYMGEYDNYDIVPIDSHLHVHLLRCMIGGSEGYYARMEVKDITYYDEHGAEFSVSYSQ